MPKQPYFHGWPYLENWTAPNQPYRKQNKIYVSEQVTIQTFEILEPYFNTSMSYI